MANATPLLIILALGKPLALSLPDPLAIEIAKEENLLSKKFSITVEADLSEAKHYWPDIESQIIDSPVHLLINYDQGVYSIRIPEKEHHIEPVVGKMGSRSAVGHNCRNEGSRFRWSESAFMTIVFPLRREGYISDVPGFYLRKGLLYDFEPSQSETKSSILASTPAKDFTFAFHFDTNFLARFEWKIGSSFSSMYSFEEYIELQNGIFLPRTTTIRYQIKGRSGVIKLTIIHALNSSQLTPEKLKRDSNRLKLRH